MVAPNGELGNVVDGAIGLGSVREIEEERGREGRKGGCNALMASCPRPLSTMCQGTVQKPLCAWGGGWNWKSVLLEGEGTCCGQDESWR